MARYRGSKNVEGCRCKLCKKANTERCAAERLKAGMKPNTGKPGVPHGASSRYSYWGCRCAKCKRGNADRVAAWKARKKENGDDL
jgi:hypothetical protein